MRGFVLTTSLLLTTLGPIAIRADESQANKLEPSFLEKQKNISSTAPQDSLELAAWCRDRGLIREMLHTVGAVLEATPDDAKARDYLHQQRDGEVWINFLPVPALLDRTLPSKSELEATRNSLLEKAKKRAFKLVKRAFRFEFWSDLDSNRVGEYAALMNRYYDHTRGFFGGADTKAGIPVRLFSKRSEYLYFYQQRTGKSGEHVGGFFSYDDAGNSLLCFYDDPFDEEDIFNTARHECTHLLLKQSLRGAEIAHWLDEGTACYLAANGLERFGSYPASCLLTVRRDLRNSSGLSLQDLMDAPYKEFTFRHYATAWAWVTYLSSDPKSKRKLTQLFLKMREKTRIRSTADWSHQKWSEECNSLFKQVVGRPDKLQPGFAEFVEKTLEPSTDQQKLYTATNALQSLLYSDSETLPLSHRMPLLREAESWLREARTSEDETVLARARLEEIRAFVARALAQAYDETEMTHTGAEIASRLDAFLNETTNDSLATEVGRVGHQALQVLRSAGKYEPTDDRPFDFVAEVSRKIDDAHEMDKAELRFERDVVENLIALSSEAFKLALYKDPGHKAACSRWLRLALEFSPRALPEVFPHLLFQVQLDPDDVRLASLAALYASMGREAYARTLLQRALQLSPKKGNLDHLAAYVTGE